MSAPTFNAGDLIGKTLIAKVRVNLYKSASDGAAPFGYVLAGQPIGTVFSYLEPSAAKNRSKLFWMFGEKENYYYVPHRTGFFDVSAIRAQGVYTSQEKKEMQENESKDILTQAGDQIKKYLPFVIGGLFALPILKEVIGKQLNRRSG